MEDTMNKTPLPTKSKISAFMSFLGFGADSQKESSGKTEPLSAKRQNETAYGMESGVDATTSEEIKDLQQSLKQIARHAKELSEKLDRLSFRDKLTGLYSLTYIRERLDEEISRAFHYQRPCAFAYVTVSNFESVARQYGEENMSRLSKGIADVFNRHIGQFDRAACVGRGEFMIIFPDKNKKKCIEVIERIGADILHDLKDVVLSVGISENPIDGVEADSLYVKAQDRMKIARTGGKLLEAFA